MRSQLFIAQKIIPWFVNERSIYFMLVVRIIIKADFDFRFYYRLGCFIYKKKTIVFFKTHSLNVKSVSEIGSLNQLFKLYFKTAVATRQNVNSSERTASSIRHCLRRTRGQCYKTFYGCKLQILVISWTVYPLQAFPG